MWSYKESRRYRCEMYHFWEGKFRSMTSLTDYLEMGLKLFKGKQRGSTPFKELFSLKRLVTSLLTFCITMYGHVKWCRLYDGCTMWLVKRANLPPHNSCCVPPLCLFFVSVEKQKGEGEKNVSQSMATPEFLLMWRALKIHNDTPKSNTRTEFQ